MENQGKMIDQVLQHVPAAEVAARVWFEVAKQRPFASNQRLDDGVRRAVGAGPEPWRAAALTAWEAARGLKA